MLSNNIINKLEKKIVASEILQLRKVEQVARYRKLQNIIKKKIKHKIKKKLYLRFKYRNGRITCLNKDPIHLYISRLSILFRFVRDGRNILYQFKKQNKTE